MHRHPIGTDSLGTRARARFLRARGARVGLVAAGLVMLVFIAGATLAPRVHQDGDWIIVSSRPAGPRDIPFDEGVPMLGEPVDRNNVPGPGTLRAVVRNRHPRVFIENSATGSSRALLDQWACLPLWSPDGKWIACSVYGSPQRPYNLGLVEMASEKLLLPELHGGLGEFKWSPDSRRLALEVNDPMGGFTVLGFFSLATRAFQPVDTLTLFADYDFAWSPDSRTIAVSKPTFTDPNNEGEVTRSDLWLMSVSGTRYRLVQGKGYLAAMPRWVDSTHVRYVRDVWKVDGSGSSDSFVVRLAPNGRGAGGPH